MLAERARECPSLLASTAGAKYNLAMRIIALMTHTELLALFDREQRRDVAYPNIRREVTPQVIRHVPLDGMAGGCFILYSSLDETNADAAIEEQLSLIHI